MKLKVGVLMGVCVLVSALAGVVATVFYLGHSSSIRIQSDRLSAIRIPEEILGHVAFASDAGILFEDRFSAQATIESQMDIPIESLFSIPLDFDITLPVNATMRVEQEFEVAMDVPIQFELSPRDLSMGAVSVDLDTEIFIDDEVEVELLVPIDATIAAFGAIPVPVAGNLPVKARVPIRQPVRIRDRVDVNLANFAVKVDTVIPIKAKVPFHQDVVVKGDVTGRIRKTIQVPINQTLSIPIRETVPVGLHMAEELKINLDGFVPTRIRFDEALPVQLQSLVIAPGDISIQPAALE